MYQDYFSFKGRISRKVLDQRLGKLALVSIPLLGIVLIVSIIVISVFENSLISFGISFSVIAAVFLPAFYSACSLYVRRGHDRNRSGQVIVYFLVAGILYFVLNPRLKTQLDSAYCYFTTNPWCKAPNLFVIWLIVMIILGFLNLFMIHYIYECTQEGPVAGAERFGKEPEE